MSPRLNPKLVQHQQHAGGKISQCLAEPEFESSFEEDQDESQHSENVNGAFESVWMDPAQDRTKRHADQQQHNDVGDAGQLGKPVRHKRQHQKCGRQTEDADHVHDEWLSKLELLKRT